MQQYDLSLKSILTRRAVSLFEHLHCREAVRWLNADLPEVKSRRADLLGETADGALIHLELQSTHDPRMSLRMLEYYLAIHSRFSRFPEQLVLYVGEPPLRMQGGFANPELSFQCRIMDIREVPGEPLLRIASLDDNILSILAGISDVNDTVRRILGKIADSAPEFRAEALTKLSILAGLRSLGHGIKEETERMPILTDFAEHDLFGPMLKSARAEGERELLLAQAGKRFGAVPDWATERINSLGAPELKQVGLRLLDADSLEDLFN